MGKNCILEHVIEGRIEVMERRGIRCEELTYLLTPWCRVLLEKLTGLQLVKKLPTFYGTRRFITAFTSFHHPSLSWTSPIQSTCHNPPPEDPRCEELLDKINERAGN
jgi:hypothetical protein